VALTILGVVVSLGAAVYEFALKGRKRLGWRVQMDTTASDLARSQGEATVNIQGYSML
jgi:phosphate transport system substrate-binding protein